MLGARCWHARQKRPSSEVTGFRLRGASALSGTTAGPVARSRRSSGRRLASKVRVRSSSPPSGQTARVSSDPMEASVRQRPRVAAAHSSGWKGKVSHRPRSPSRHSTSRSPGSWPAGTGLEVPLEVAVLLAGGVETTTSASGGSGREASPACALFAASAGLVGLLASAWVSDSEGLAGLSGRMAGSAAASETCWRAEATASKESSSLGVAPTSSCMGSGWAVSLASMEAEDTEPASISTGSQWAASTGAKDWCWACSACLALVVFLAVRLAQGEASGKTSCCSDEELEEELTACAGGTALGGGSVLEAAVGGGSHTPGGLLGLGLGGGGGWRGVVETDSPFGAAAALALAKSIFSHRGERSPGQSPVGINYMQASGGQSRKQASCAHGRGLPCLPTVSYSLRSAGSQLALRNPGQQAGSPGSTAGRAARSDLLGVRRATVNSAALGRGFP